MEAGKNLVAYCFIFNVVYKTERENDNTIACIFFFVLTAA